MEETWVSHALRRLPDTVSCPACGAPLRGAVCGTCALDLGGRRGIDVHEASLAVERAIRERQRILDQMRAEQPAAAAYARKAEAAGRAAGTAGAKAGQQRAAGRSAAPERVVAWSGEAPPVRRTPRGTAKAPETGLAPGDAVPGGAWGGTVVSAGSADGSARPVEPARPATPPSTVALQPILAGVGAALLAVSAVVFVFFTLADQLVLRTVATLLVTVASVVAAALMRRAGLRSSAEAVGTLAVALGWVCAELGLEAGLLGGVEPFLARAALLALLAPALVVLGGRLRVRSWVAAGALSAPLAPVLLATGLSDVGLLAWVWILALVATALVAHGAIGALRRVGERLGVVPRWESRVLGVVRAVAVPGALVAIFALPDLAPLPFALWWAAVSVGAVAAGHALRVRPWVTTGLLTAPFAAFPAALALADDTVELPWAVAAGALLVALATLAGPVVARVTGPRVGSTLRVELGLLEAVQVLGALLAVGATFLVPPARFLAGVPGDAEKAAVLAVTAVVAAVLRRGTHRRWWTFVAGGLGAVAAMCLGAWEGAELVWVLPAAAGVAWAVLAVVLTVLVAARARLLVPAARTRADLLLAAWLVAVVATVPAMWSAAQRVPEVLVGPLGAAPAVVLDDGPLGGPYLSLDARAAATLGVVVLALLVLAAARLGIAAGPATAVPAPLVRNARGLASWVTVGLAVVAALHTRLTAAASLTLLALLAAVLLAATADPDRSWRPLRGAVTGVRAALDGLRRAAGFTTRFGGSPMSPAEGASWRPAALTGACVALGLLAVGSWQSRPSVLVATVVAVPLVLAARAALPRAVHPALVGGAYAYALVVGGVWLGWLGFGWVAAVCTVSAAASMAAVAVTVGTRVTRGEWFAVLGVTAVPFALGVYTVVLDRTWWSAGAATAMLVLELVLLLTRRTGLAPAVRVIAAGLVLPTVSVAVVSAGAVLLPGSGSPVLLPVIAAVAAVVAGGAPRVAAFLSARVTDGSMVGALVRATLETSVLVTGAITIGLAYGRPSAGPDIAVAVLLLLAVGAGVVAREPDRTRVWWLAGALATAAVWTALADGGVRFVEAYTLPPAVAAVLVGALLARRGGSHGWRLVAAGLVLALVPSDLTLALGTRPGDPRAWILLVTGVVLTIAIVALRRWPLVSAGWSVRARALLAGAVLLVGVGLTVESLQVAAAPDGEPGLRFAAGLGWAVVAGALALVAVNGVRRGASSARLLRVLDAAGRVPALVFLTVGAVANTEPHWGAIAALWVLEVALLVLLVVVARRLLRGHTTGVPSWAVWMAALAVGIAAWVPRELRVEVFSVPLGVGLVVAGCFALGEWEARTRVSGPGSAPVPERTLVGWPVGWTGSWALLGPGILALLGPSVLATFTDPQTWRAVLVVAVALTGVLVGSRRGLAAPFLLGVWVLPIEVLIVFVSQLGTEISAVPWMLTLAAAGGVLLIIATLDERRTEGYGGAAAYLRDLR
ncbi:SCO7613 C-terminal domain-containing membrane protein [Promicromonospora kroppenstedtii]|uniref:SCO7613 C-terminal domain-containing membrane protein n=1 Tax=Promicromonospora kroppenstedtii TaxID=440482 RepID=A0ABW7XR42_9MICO